jgi:NAD(P)-dependent dehydrogenase (short-subunit alcohol dehydrogenase family)
MEIQGTAALVTGGASGLGLATVEGLAAAGGYVTIVDQPTSQGKDIAEKLGDAVSSHVSPVNASVDLELTGWRTVGTREPEPGLGPARTAGCIPHLAQTTIESSRSAVWSVGW